MLSHARSPECLSRLAVDQLLNGEPELAANKAHRASCPRCLERIAAHRRERAAFAVPRRGWPWVVAAAAAAFALWLAVPQRAETTRVKGKPALGFYLKHGDAIRRGGDGERVAPGDAIDFTASSAALAYLAIISVDGARHVSVYYPAGPTAAAIAGPDQLLPLSVRLDAVLGTERVSGVFCDHPAAVAALADAVTRGVVPEGCTIDTLTLEKR